jgi:uncharacterized membrane protein HdeD (DUF308 family)
VFITLEERAMLDNNSWSSTAEHDPRHLQPIWGCLVALGIALIVVGFAAIGAPVVATVTTVTIFGILLLVGAAVELVSMIWVRRWGSYFHHLLSGLLNLFLGVVLLERPTLGAAAYTLLLAVFFVASGVARVVFALAHRYPGRGWTILSGAVAVVLGVMIWRELPESALWVIGTFVGIEFVFNGVSWLMLGLAVPNLRESVESRMTGEAIHV